MNLKEYTNFTRTTAVYPENMAVFYPMIGMVNEAGEALGKIKKVLRGDKKLEEQREPLLDELGDVLYYIVRAIDDLGCNVEDVLIRNVDKLTDRKVRGVIKGDGDVR